MLIKSVYHLFPGSGKLTIMIPVYDIQKCTANIYCQTAVKVGTQ